MSDEIKTFSIHVVGRKRAILIDAVYYRIDNGIAYFRIPNASGYPTCVRCFAAGMWVDIEEVVKA